MNHDDQDIANVLRALERPLSPGPAADARIEARVLRALAESPAEELHLSGHDETRRSRQPVHTALLVAATVLAIVGGLALVARTADPEPPALGGSVLPTPTSSAESSLPSDSAPMTDPRVTLPPNILGYQPFTSTGFSLGPPGAAPESGAVLERVGDVAVEADGFVAAVRRVIGPDITDLEVVILEDGSALVPVEYIDPPSLGGRCTGGRVLLTTIEPTETQSTDGRCSGRNTTIRIDTQIGAAESHGAADATTTLQPVTYTLTIDDSTAPRSFTLWHEGDDLVRLEAGEVPTDLEPSTIIDPNTEERP